ncbi:helicase associated domain-containing protein [Arthrobacter sp. ISL-85]|uniref:helicase associated domain-containing protein n=1 Tax=Arthrobacter sp. ISL-85 TaxID=2819115 RepID=UPI001BEA01A4|nr:helicase associated domain-containing protein [Arthrobacter sp. ISL-85]MBT2566224.1 helicase associated domain-containing protein [Arthrobacter sp. ISL-85]
MTQIKHRAPNPEWVQMYRSGIPACKIALVTGVALATIRYHLGVAAKQDRDLRAEHQAALPPPAPRITAVGQRNLDDILAFHEAEGRLPVHGRSKRESTLAEWLTRQRKDSAAGTLSPTYAKALDTIPGWRDNPTKRDTDAARWKQRLAEVTAWRAAGNDWPRHQKTDNQEERTLGVWLHTQRIDHRAGKLTDAKEKQLNKVIPGWRQGRVRRGGNSYGSGRL